MTSLDSCSYRSQTLLAGQMGLAGEMPDYMLNEGRHAPLYFSEQRLYLRKPDGECFYVNPRYAHAHAMHMHMPCTSHALTHHPAASLPRVLPRSPAAPQPRRGPRARIL